MALPADMAVGRRGFSSQQTQATVSIANADTQCALGFLSSTGCQTDVEFTDSQGNASQIDASYERDSEALGAEDAMDTVPKRQRKYRRSKYTRRCQDGDTFSRAQAVWRARSTHAMALRVLSKTDGREDGTKTEVSSGNVGLRPKKRKPADGHVPVQTEENLCGFEPCQKSDHETTHLTVHKGPQAVRLPYICSVCNMTFTCQQNLVAHMRVHVSEKPYACKFGLAFIVQQNGLAHEESHAGGVVPYVCSVCRKRCGTKNTVLLIMRSHTAAQSRMCAVCIEKGVLIEVPSSRTSSELLRCRHQPHCSVPWRNSR